MENRKRVYIDMDNVMCDFDARFKERVEENPIIGWPPCEHGFFRDLLPLPGAIEGVNTLREKYEVYTLTRPSVRNPMCYTEKRDWIGKYFDLEMCQNLIICYHKHLVIGEYLIDDNLHPGFMGEHIHFGTDRFPNWDSVLKYLM